MFVSQRAFSISHNDYAHRPGGIALTELQHGEPFALDNFQLYLIHATDDFTTPRHRHNFEQVRIMLRGDFEYGPGQVQKEGTVGYFCEGTFYTQQGRGESEMLLLQVAGASGQSYMSPTQLREGIAALQAQGRFEDGMFIPAGDDGAARARDSYEAIWEHIFARTLTYPRPRYGAPVMMHPDAFAYVSVAAGVERRALGTFNERGLSVAQLRLAAGTRWDLHAEAQPLVGYVLRGSGTIAGEPLAEGTAFQLKRGETAAFSIDGEAEAYLFGLPVFSA